MRAILGVAECEEAGRSDRSRGPDWLRSTHPAVRAAAAGGVGCLLIQATAIHALESTTGVFGRELLLTVAIVVAVSVGGALPVRALGLPGAAPVVIARTVYPCAFLLLLVATNLVSRDTTAESFYAAIVVLGLTL